MNELGMMLVCFALVSDTLSELRNCRSSVVGAATCRSAKLNLKQQVACSALYSRAAAGAKRSVPPANCVHKAGLSGSWQKLGVATKERA